MSECLQGSPAVTLLRDLLRSCQRQKSLPPSRKTPRFRRAQAKEQGVGLSSAGSATSLGRDHCLTHVVFSSLYQLLFKWESH